MIDSHCHLDAREFDADRGAVLARARARGVTDLVLPGVDRASWVAIRELAKTTAPRCHAAIGVHPIALPLVPSANDEALFDALSEEANRPHTVAIGECGLDTTIDLALAPLARQVGLLRLQLALARRLELPVILHARGPGCYAALLDVLRGEPPTPGVVHSYGGGAELLRSFLKLPLLFGFAGPATYANARKVQASIRAVPDDRLLAETDAPDQTPEPRRPNRSEPAFVADVIAGLAQLRGASVTDVAELTASNARRLFRL